VESLAFGKYQLYERIAEGGMAVVWRAKLHGPGGFEKSLVVKQIRPELAARDEFVDLFVAEAKLTVSLSHANIVPVFELGMVDGTYFLALELVDGPPLSLLIEQGPVSPFVAAYIVEQVLRGLDYAHSRGVVHRDLSAANVLVSRDGEVKIVDFGIAAPVAERGVRGGSRGYVAPEQEAGGRADARSDLYAVGVLLWELCTGRRFDGGAPTAPSPLASVIARATAADPDARHPDAASLLKEVTRYLRNLSTAPNQMELSALVRKRCPDLPSTSSARSSVEVDKPEGPRTKPLERGREITFATRLAPVARPRRRVWLPLAAGAAALGALALVRQSAAPVDQPKPDIIKTDTKAIPAPAPSEVKSETPIQPATEIKKPVIKKKGLLTLNALPWAHVTIDGASAPDTPIRALSLPAGPHAVKLSCPPTGRDFKLTIMVEPDAEVRRVVDLRGEPKILE
jgi:serine/threonine-protein kinase